MPEWSLWERVAGGMVLIMAAIVFFLVAEVWGAGGV